jgi:putative two-component system response regulator
MSTDPLHDSRIVIVDDEEANMRLLKRMLVREGYTNVTGLTDPTEALTECAHHPPDLLLLDLRMPGMDGYEVLSRLEPITDDEWLPVIVLTAERGGEAKRRALTAGAHDFLTKPFDRQEAMLRIHHVLHTHVLQRRLTAAKTELEGTVEERTAELGHARLEILQRLAAAGEFRDDATGEHAARVGRRAAHLARTMRRPDAEVELIRHAGTLHDIGKIAIADEILLKPDKLTDAEYALMKTHTTAGADLLAGSDSPLLQMAERIARSHHERWDGDGYPNGLAGKDIPIEARIVAVADVFDALTQDRPYRDAWVLDKAIKEIEAQRGRQFDPDVVDAFSRTIGALVRPNEGEGDVGTNGADRRPGPSTAALMALV